MSHDYVWEKFFTAVMSLATSQATLQERLADAYRDSLVRLKLDELPVEVKGDFQGLLNALDRVPSGGAAGTVAVSAATLSELEAKRLIESVISMYDKVAKYGPNGGAFESDMER